MAQSRLGLQAIVEHDDAARLHVAQGVAHTVVTAQRGVEISAQHLPHDDPEACGQGLGLAQRQASVGWTEQAGAGDRLALQHIAQVVPLLGPPTVRMVPGMVAHRMSILPDAGQDIRMRGRIAPDAEEGALGLEQRQLVQHPGCDLGYRTIIKCEINGIFVQRKTPRSSLENQTQKTWGFV